MIKWSSRRIVNPFAGITRYLIIVLIEGMCTILIRWYVGSTDNDIDFCL